MSSDQESRGPAEEQQYIPSGQNVVNNYYGPVNNVERAENCNFGENNGYLIQNRGASQTSGSSTGVDGREAQPPEPPIARPLILTGLQHDIFTLLNPVLDASHTRNRRVSPPNSACFPGTRESVISLIRTWANSSLIFNDNPHIMWIYGYAGCGKSAIAQQVAEYFAGNGQLAASFFFFRGSGDRNNMSRFATSIASQLASAVPATAPSIEAAVTKNRGLLTTTTATPSAQFQHLIYEPINGLRWDSWAASLLSGPFLIVLDGLDECEDRGEVAAFIEHMIAFFAKKPRTPLRFLITSRVESHIHQQLHLSTQVRLLNLVRHTSGSDIEAALDVAIEREKRSRLLVCAQDWPSPEDKDKLVMHINGSYIFMTTIIRLLFDDNLSDGLTPMTRLPLILSLAPDFDDLYKSVLSPSRHLPHFHGIVSTIALAKQSLSIVQIADLMEIGTVDVVHVLVNLHSIMQIPGDDHTSVTLWHTSLRDFLCSEDRSGPFFANPNHHRRLAYRGANSHSPLGNSSSQYLRYAALYHLEKFLDTLDNGVSSVNTERDNLTGLLNGPIFESGWTTLEAACHSGKWMLVKTLVNANVDISIQFQDSRHGAMCALHAVCARGRFDLISLLLENGADPNIVSPKQDWGGFHYGTPLAFAAHVKNANLVTQLLERGADPNLQGGTLGTALQAACGKGSVEIVNLLLDHGADPNLGGGEWGSALHASAYLGHHHCARALLTHKADPDILDKHHGTPLQNACYQGYNIIVEYLLEFKADASIKNGKGMTALMFARDCREHHVVELLLQHGTVE